MQIPALFSQKEKQIRFLHFVNKSTSVLHIFDIARAQWVEMTKMDD